MLLTKLCRLLHFFHGPRTPRQIMWIAHNHHSGAVNYPLSKANEIAVALFQKFTILIISIKYFLVNSL